MVRISVFLAAAMMFALTACTAVTDFEMPKDLYDLNANIPADITVTLAGDGTGSLTLNLSDPLPGDEGTNEALLALLADGTVNLNVQNDTTQVAFDLLGSGTRVTATPAAAGEYTLTLDETTRTALTIVFYNATTDGSALQAGQGYTALIDVLDNKYFVATEVTPITPRPVTVN